MEPLSEQIETGQATFKNRQSWNCEWITHMPLEQSMYIDVWDPNTGHGKPFQYVKYIDSKTGNPIFYISEAECYFVEDAFSKIEMKQ